ncbi:hypothetical protein C1646_708820 [Rhizophagus diaphanus]|nr:hypothetical protein C1646_708820 [Rhizophagus diaphanus] [Rhizophagus sp. MUCL 43196]
MQYLIVYVITDIRFNNKNEIDIHQRYVVQYFIMLIESPHHHTVFSNYFTTFYLLKHNFYGKYIISSSNKISKL